MKKTLLLITLLISYVDIFAQQTAYYTQNFVNPIFMNPAETGTSKDVQCFVNYHRKWIGFVGAPETKALTLDAPLKNKKMGIGLILENDVVNILGNTSAQIAYAYQVDVNEENSLRFGMSVGLAQSRILYDRVNAKDMDEVLLFDNNQKSTNFNGNAGLVYRWKKLKVSIAAQQLFHSAFKYEDQFDEVEMKYRLLRHYNSLLSYDFNLNESWGLTPHFTIRGAEGLPLNYELGTLLKHKQNTWLDVNYRHNISVVVSTGVTFEDRFIVGVGYEIATQEVSNYSGGSFELILGIKFKNTKSDEFKSHKLKDLEKLTAELLERTDALEQENERFEQEKRDLKDKIYQLEDVFRNHEKNQKELERLQRENQLKYQDTLNKKNVKKELFITSDTDLENLEGKEQYNYYVVLGANKTFENAKKHQKMLLRVHQIDTKVVQSSSKTWYFLYSKKTNNTVEFKKELSKMRKIGAESSVIKGAPWGYLKLK